MTRKEIFEQCVDKIAKTNSLLMELPTGYGKSKLSIDLINHILGHHIEIKGTVNILILVAKRVHKQTWKEEIDKWGGIKHPLIQANSGFGEVNIHMECYESLHKHATEHWHIVLLDECHHVGSDIRLEALKTIKFDYMIGLSATIPRKLKMYFKYRYHADIVSCDIVEAIENDVLPEPQILLFPLILDNRTATETWEINTRAGEQIHYGTIGEIWKYKKLKVHAILSCTQKQKLIEFNKLIDWEKNKYMQTHNEAIKQSWLFHAGKRLEYLSDIKIPIVKDILQKLQHYRTITFCKTIEQSEVLGKNCVHSQNKKADDIYDKFNQKKINHITAVNILNENANLIDCKYGIFTNISASDIVQVQRCGRLLRHKSPVIIVPYFDGTREAEIVKKMFEDYNKDFIKTIHSIQEIT